MSAIDALGKIAAAYNSTTRAPVDALIQSGQVIEFHNPRGIYGDPIIFPAFLTDFVDSVKAEFTETNTYGRMDPIYSFKNTKREISFSLDIPAESIDVAKDNLTKVKKLQSLLYPSYSTSNSAKIISTAPLFQIKFNNLINDEQGQNGKLLGMIPSLDFAPNLEPGMFYENGLYYPKLLKLSVVFNPLHAGPRGWGDDGHALSTFTDTGFAGGPNTAGPPPDANSGVLTGDEQIAKERAARIIAENAAAAGMSGGERDASPAPLTQTNASGYPTNNS